MNGAAARPVVFLFPGLASDLAELSALTIGCGNALTAVPIGYPHWTEIRNRALRLDDFVAYCKRQIEAYPAAGPGILAGYSFGGHMAFAVAAELEASGRRVGRLGLLDTAARPLIETGRRSASRRLRELANAFRNNEGASQTGRIIAGLMRLSGFEWPLDLAARLRFARLPFNMARHVDLALQMHFNFQILLELLERMALPSTRCEFTAVLFRCVNYVAHEPEDLEWNRHLTHVQVVPVPGDHLSLMDPPNIASLCRTFSFAMAGEPPHPGGICGRAPATSCSP
jgi:thioesterase domain-containing protein